MHLIYWKKHLLLFFKSAKMLMLTHKVSLKEVQTHGKMRYLRKRCHFRN